MKVFVRPLDEPELSSLADKKLQYPDHPLRSDTELGVYQFVNTQYEAWGFASVLQAAKQRYNALLAAPKHDSSLPVYVLSKPNELNKLDSKSLKEYLSGVNFGQGCIHAIQLLPLPVIIQVLEDLSIQAAELYYGISNDFDNLIHIDGVH